MIRVTAPSRLHFGSFSLPNAGQGRTWWADLEGRPKLPARHFGGVGLMIDRPGFVMSVRASDALKVVGPLAERGYQIVKEVVRNYALSDLIDVNIERCPPAHVGLGAGTQFALSLAYAVRAAYRWRTLGPPFTLESVAATLGRGRRSALGIHGFEKGGFLVEGGKDASTRIAPLVCHHVFPPEWLALLVIPRGLQGTHGATESEAFARLTGSTPDLRRIEVLTRLVLLGMLPCLVTRDLDGFGEAVYDFNRRVGEMFAPWQGGIYSHPRVAEIVGILRNAGVRGVGQSSWGPTVFAIVTAEQAHELVERLPRENHVAAEELTLAEASRGVVLEGALETAH